jgi:hypothetical protein
MMNETLIVRTAEEGKSHQHCGVILLIDAQAFLLSGKFSTPLSDSRITLLPLCYLQATKSSLNVAHAFFIHGNLDCSSRRVVMGDSSRDLFNLRITTTLNS